jgi:hypothetical protein
VKDACPITLNHGVIGNGRVLGLISPSIHIDWLCMPRTGMLLGNFPQAYTHVGLIHTAVTISELLEARDARFRAWS